MTAPRKQLSVMTAPRKQLSVMTARNSTPKQTAPRQQLSVMTARNSTPKQTAPRKQLSVMTARNSTPKQTAPRKQLSVMTARNSTTKSLDKVNHPAYVEMVAKAIINLKDRRGSSRQAIIAYIETNYNVPKDRASTHVKATLKKGEANGVLKRARESGKGSGRYKLVTDAKKKPVPKKSKSKKNVAEKLADKKSATKKMAVKKLSKN